MQLNETCARHTFLYLRGTFVDHPSLSLSLFLSLSLSQSAAEVAKTHLGGVDDLVRFANFVVDGGVGGDG